ncbi:hypothetical protein [Halodesulfovibrio marinisediminis]|uniref:Uncharacterized protein n=1 Tax=Halodesulfovibrio marinisediminis DSM 17456 TaxID=1121457 RepID=A0A1N6I931_9BACT|nr:hypothetical protein [Halodesulfovibrio marinisediminis]SIO28510.1 hypothetical protein SAMN02745161_2532 [Halodesulfovibrio marinisediminis DSM 17456]
MVDIASLALKLTELWSCKGEAVPSGKPDPALVREFKEALAGSRSESSAVSVEGLGGKDVELSEGAYIYPASLAEGGGRTSAIDALGPHQIETINKVEGTGEVQEELFSRVTLTEDVPPANQKPVIWEVQDELMRTQPELGVSSESTSLSMQNVKKALGDVMSEVATKGTITPHDVLRIQNLTGMLQHEILQMSKINKSIQDTVTSVTKAQ